MKLVYICSPYRATDAETLQRNIEYAKTLTRAALLRGECPVTTHLYMTQCLDENIEGERGIGLAAGTEILRQCDLVIVGMGRTGQALESIGVDGKEQCINENARVALDQTEYQAKYNALADRFEKAKERLETVSMEITEKQARREIAEQCLAEIAKQEGVVSEFDEDLWYALIDYATVHGKDDVRFTFKDGTEIKV